MRTAACGAGGRLSDLVHKLQELSGRMPDSRDREPVASAADALHQLESQNARLVRTLAHFEQALCDPHSRLYVREGAPTRSIDFERVTAVLRERDVLRRRIDELEALLGRVEELMPWVDCPAREVEEWRELQKEVRKALAAGAPLRPQRTPGSGE